MKWPKLTALCRDVGDFSGRPVEVPPHSHGGSILAGPQHQGRVVSESYDDPPGHDGSFAAAAGGERSGYGADSEQGIRTPFQVHSFACFSPKWYVLALCCLPVEFKALLELEPVVVSLSVVHGEGDGGVEAVQIDAPLLRLYVLALLVVHLQLQKRFLF